MSTAEERFAYVRAEIERDLNDSEEHTIKQQPGNQTTDSPKSSFTANIENTCPTVLDIETMMESRDRNNWIYQVDYDKPNEASVSVGGAVKNWLKQKIRRIIAPVIAPLVLDQNTFNASVTTSINVLSDNECKIAEFIKKQEEENLALRKDLIQLEQKVVQLSEEVSHLREENITARQEIIQVRKRLHREMLLLLEDSKENMPQND